VDRAIISSSTWMGVGDKVADEDRKQALLLTEERAPWKLWGWLTTTRFWCEGPRKDMT
jgi:hypothetical protein